MPFKPARRPCPICTQAAVEVLHTQRFILPVGSPLPECYDVVVCPDCGFVYADSPASQDNYDRYYAEFSKYEDPSVATGGGASEPDRCRLTALAEQVALQAPLTARVLDIGCAAGGLLAALRAKGFTRLYGIDSSPGCVVQVRALGFDAVCVPLARLADVAVRGRFDLVILSHVLEHVLDIRALMAVVVALTAPHGNIYIETPDAARYDEYDCYVPYYFFDSEHINHFDTGSLISLGRTLGLHATDFGEKTLLVGDGKPYPACWVLLNREPPQGGDRTCPAPSPLRDRMARYVAASAQRQHYPALERLIESGEPAIVWGAGSFAQRLFAETAIGRCNLVSIVDNDRNKQGRSFAGLVVEAPDTALLRTPDATVLVAAAVHEAAIVAEARALGSTGSILMLASTQTAPASGVATIA